MSKPSLIFVILVILSLQACARPPEPADRETARTALVGRVEGGAAIPLLAVGHVRSAQLAVIGSEQGGRVLELLSDVGDQVTTGQPLARLDPIPSRLRSQGALADLRRADAIAEEREHNAARVARMYAEGVATRAELEAAQADAAAATAARRTAAAALAMASRDEKETILRAPFNGVVAARPALVSSVLAPGAPAFEIEGDGERRIHAVLAARHADGLAPGTQVAYVYGGRTWSARLSGVSSRDNGAGGREAVFQVVTGSPAPGATVEISISGRRPEPALIVPLAAVLTDRAGRQSVRLVGPGNRLKDIPVNLLALHGASAEVSAPLSAGQLLVVAGAEHFDAGMTIRPQLAQR